MHAKNVTQLMGISRKRDVGQGLNEGERIRSVPGNRVRPVRSSAIMQPTDQMSTTTQNKNPLLIR